MEGKTAVAGGTCQLKRKEAKMSQEGKCNFLTCKMLFLYRKEQFSMEGLTFLPHLLDFYC